MLLVASQRRVAHVSLVPGGAIVPIARVADPAELRGALSQLGLARPRPTLVVVGGAAGLDADAEALERLRPLFVAALAPAVCEAGAYVVDGGTDAGVMRLMGQARAAVVGAFPLVGVAPVDAVALPGRQVTDAVDEAPLEPHHTHFVLVPGARWGDEAPWLARVAGALAGDRPSVTVLVHGGQIAWKDAALSVEDGRPVLVVAGSGGTADALASALNGRTEAVDRRAPPLQRSGLVRAVGPAVSATQLDAVARAVTVMLVGNG